MKKRILACASVTVIASMMMANTVMADDFKVGICNYVDDASLNQIVENIQNRLEEIGEEQGVTFEGGSEGNDYFHSRKRREPNPLSIRSVC